MHPTKEEFLALLRTDDEAARAAFVQQLPAAAAKANAESLFGTARGGMAVVAIAPLIQQYCVGTDPRLGAVLAAGAHERAQELVRTVADHGLLPTTRSGLACNHLRALSLEGRSEDLLAAAADYIPLYEGLGVPENLSTMRVLRIEALVNLGRLDDAEVALRDPSLFADPINAIEARRLESIVDRWRANATHTKDAWRPAPIEPNAEAMAALLAEVAKLGGGDTELGAFLRKQLDPGARLDPADPVQRARLSTLQREGEALLMQSGGAGSELAIRGSIREATDIFVGRKPDADEIARSLCLLEASLVQARSKGLAAHENDALWGIYLCHARLGRPSSAADALIMLRGNLETLRRGIRDPLHRGGVFSGFQYLFHGLCEQLHKSGRHRDLFVAIESSKGRVIADRLAAADATHDDSATYRAIGRVPELTQRHGFHYLTYFVDETCVYAAFVSKAGTMHAPAPMQVSSEELRRAAANVDPALWRDDTPPVSARLAPLIDWLFELMTQGIVTPGDHICYSADDDFNNVPLHYLHCRGSILIDHVSVSRVHSAFHLDRLLAHRAAPAPAAFTAFVVPTRQDLDTPEAATFLANLDRPIAWLADHGLAGRAVRLTDATPTRVTQEPLRDRVVHFSTHGAFPTARGNPFHDSYLLLADQMGLPDQSRISRGEHAGRLTPAAILEAKLDLTGSHVSLMACVSGLAKEGIGGDALGLDWALVQAGAASLISTHWQVGAAAAARFFIRFYARWIDDEQSRAAAFRATMLEQLDGRRDEASLRQWAAFSLTGDFR